MVFRINQFKSTMDKYGGPSRTSLFTVSITPNRIGSNGNMPEQDMLFFCKTVTLPSIGVNTLDYRPNGFDMSQAIPTSVATEPVQCVFMLDSDHRVMSYFHSWIQSVVNYSTQGGILSSVDGKMPYEFGYKEDYKTTITIRHYNSENDSSRYYEYILRDAFPTRIDPVNLSWEDNNSPATVGISFSYGALQFTGESAGSPTERFSRGTGLIERIASIGSIGQKIRQSSLPTSIQDAVNQFTRVNNSFSAIKNTVNTSANNVRSVFDSIF